MRLASLLFMVLLLAFGCQRKGATTKRYFDLDSLINSQVTNLSRSKASLKKEASILGKSSTSINALDSTSWSHELDVFRQLDLINLPIYSDVYEIKNGTKDSKSNLLIRSFEAPANSAVPYLRLFYQTSPARLKKLEAQYREANSLYNTQRKLVMYFDDSAVKALLTRFLIEGTQKMIFSDSVQYTIRAEIQLTKIL
jgi:hypothetical protein